jgi:hypothetical protein
MYVVKVVEIVTPEKFERLVVPSFGLGCGIQKIQLRQFIQPAFWMRIKLLLNAPPHLKPKLYRFQVNSGTKYYTE